MPGHWLPSEWPTQIDLSSARAFRAGKADLLTMHSGDITTNLAADGFGINLRRWTRNEHSVVGSAHDPAGRG